MDEYIKNQLKNRDNSIGELGTTASFKINEEAKYCKI